MTMTVNRRVPPQEIRYPSLFHSAFSALAVPACAPVFAQTAVSD